eukprot:scaffold65650_cov33-Tisochrysis_lutea.AAC.2
MAATRRTLIMHFTSQQSAGRSLGYQAITLWRFRQIFVPNRLPRVLPCHPSHGIFRRLIDAFCSTACWC